MARRGRGWPNAATLEPSRYAGTGGPLQSSEPEHPAAAVAMSYDLGWAVLTSRLTHLAKWASFTQ